MSELVGAILVFVAFCVLVLVIGVRIAVPDRDQGEQ